MNGTGGGCGYPVPVSATGLVLVRPGRLLGFFVATTAAGILTLRDGGAAGALILGPVTPLIGWHFLPVVFSQSLHVTVAGAINATFVVG